MSLLDSTTTFRSIDTTLSSGSYDSHDSAGSPGMEGGLKLGGLGVGAVGVAGLGADASADQKNIEVTDGSVALLLERFSSLDGALHESEARWHSNRKREHLRQHVDDSLPQVQYYQQHLELLDEVANDLRGCDYAVSREVADDSGGSVLMMGACAGAAGAEDEGGIHLTVHARGRPTSLGSEALGGGSMRARDQLTGIVQSYPN
ncbi:hypothetical protein B484DRAFT_402722 [Ochromonadaceae sp. CCMP2298]|nr:hypothetical protein B484DRAFT_402722 [Ochromonadaceae sp. CCMP2298]